MPTSTKRTLAALVAAASLGGAGWALADSSTGTTPDAAPSPETPTVAPPAMPLQDAVSGPQRRDCPERSGAGGGGEGSTPNAAPANGTGETPL